MQIRQERATDFPSTYRVNHLAFGSEAEALIVEAVRQDGNPVISLVADDHAEIVGHILFSQVTFAQPDIVVMGLAPMAVLPSRQRRGIGSALVTAGLEECRRLGAAGCVVIGHAAFYPRFGFDPASRFGLTCEFEVPDDVFLAVEFAKDALRKNGGVIRYHPAFSAP